MNLYKQLLDLLPKTPLLIGTVVEVSDGMSVVQELGGGRTRVYGTGTIDSKVFFRNGAIVSDAPDLTEEQIDV